MAIGFTLPFAQSSGSVGYFEVTSDEISAVKENLKSLILTNRGERPMHYNFGCDISSLLFEQMHGSELKERISERISSQAKMWMPFVSLDYVSVLFQDDDPSLPSNTIGIRIAFMLTSKPDLTGELNFVIAHPEA